jgi:radical SAM protein with 4Fe4S-binding SPASM domain
MKNHKTEGDIVESLIKLKGSNFLDYRKQWDLVNNFELETEFPLFIHIETSYQCNFKCPMCVQGQPDLKEKFGYSERMTTPEIIKILEEGERHNCPSISFQGDNEPFLIKEIPHWFSLAKKHGFQDIMVNTNGSIMTERLAEKIVQSGLTRIRFSLDAISEETYAKIRIGGRFKKVMGNIELFLQKRAQLKSELPKVGVNFVRMKDNEHEIDAFIEYWDKKVDFVKIQDFMTPDTEGDFNHMKGETQTSVSNFRCNQPWQRLYIRGNGEVTPCCAMFSSYLKLGELGNQSLHELWNSKNMKDLRKLHAEGRFAENPVCLKCSKYGG